MDSEFCRNCKSLKIRLLENTHRGSNRQQPFRTVFVQLLCCAQEKEKILALEPVGQAELVTEDYALLCQPNGTCTGVVTDEFLSKQMIEDYDEALKRAFHRIDGYGQVEMPADCEYGFEQELSNMNGIVE